MSAKYQDLKTRWDMGYITISVLKRWVAVNEQKPGTGITAEEFKLITGEEYKIKNGENLN